MDALTPAEKKIASFISEHGESVLSMPIDELASLTGVSKSAIIRCSKSLGFEGYTALKLSLAADLMRKDTAEYSDAIGEDETAESIINKIFSADIRTLQDTMRLLNPDSLDKAARLLAGARTIYIFGIGTSGILSSDFQCRLSQVGYNAVASADISTMKYLTINIKKGDVVFAFSNSGRTIATIETLRIAKKQGAATICLTGFTGSPITELCDCVLYTTANELKYPIESITSRVARVAVLDALIVMISTLNYTSSIEKMLETRKLVSGTRLP